MKRETLEAIIADLKAGRAPALSAEDFPCFSEEALEGNEHVSPAYLDMLAKCLTAADIPTFERALRAICEGDLAWLGFKIVYDADEAQRNTDNEVTKKYGDTGSADGEPLVFFCNDAKEIVASREPSPRDVFQMKDVTRGPSMHNEQFEGLTWLSVPLFEAVRVWLLGASDAASEVAALAAHYVGMMGCAGKNDRVHDLVLAAGATEEDWERVKRPIGLKFGAKTPAELAIAIVAELVDVRYRQRYTEEARAKHEKSLGRE